ncbi:TPA: hypothetical protein ACGOA2_000078 [Streptococcus agalactiae]|uniref:hypothetical protein n=1 Tax=Streptococcus agalactiae TaxID=1311 RepID=UPI0020C1549C|nr:hypothetical protein [Streptococcus agalactiae]MCL6310770.1 hypothetical protein [Streptococcus agalactiae]
MSYFFTIAFIVSCVGVWYYTKKKPNKRFRNFAIILALLSFVVVGLTGPKTQKELKNNNKSVLTKTKESKKTDTEELDYSSSSTEEPSDSTTSSSSSSTTESSKEPFNPNNYQVVDFNEWNHDKVSLATRVQITGKVLQVQKSDDSVNLRVAINDDYDQVVLVSIETSDYKDIIAENDNVTVYGLNAGLTSYKTTLGSELTVPSMWGTNYTVNSYGN